MGSPTRTPTPPNKPIVEHPVQQLSLFPPGALVFIYQTKSSLSIG